MKTRLLWGAIAIALFNVGCPDGSPSAGAGGSGGTTQASSGSQATGGGTSTTSQGGGGQGGGDEGGAGQGGAGQGGAEQGGGGQGGGASEAPFVGSWACGPQLTEMNNLPLAPGLAGNTLRQVVYTSIGGSKIRLRLSNEFGNGDVTMSSVHVAESTTKGAINTGTDKALTFSGKPSVTIAKGAAVYSDPVDYALKPITKMAITIHFDAVPSDVTGHPGSRTNYYLAAGDVVSKEDLSSEASAAHWYYITGLDVVSKTGASIVTLGDSITDGRGSTTDGNDRWPDFLSRRLQDDVSLADIGVLNQGIGGNTVLSGGLGPTALARFDRDVLDMRGVRWVIVLEGVNDIGGAADASVADKLIDAYKTFIGKAHGAKLKIYGSPILPFAGSQYDSAAHEAARTKVNDWVRMSGEFDGVIDLDAAVRDPANPTTLLPAYDTGDHLHLNPTGYEAMADAIDLKLFSK